MPPSPPQAPVPTPPTSAVGSRPAARKGLSRRQLLGGAIGASVLGGGYWFGYRRGIPVGLIGAGLRGRFLAERLKWSRPLPVSGDIVAIADVDSGRAAAVRDRHAPGAEFTQDYRQVLERDDVRAVVVATPDHWHARIALEALDAGKHVYLEKPISLTIDEGELLVRAVERSGRVFQAGTQQRSDWRFRTAVELVRNGRLGALTRVRVRLPLRRGSGEVGPFASQAVPDGLDWERWLGQAPEVSYCPERCHGSFRRWFEYAGGLMTDWGAHHIDCVQWALDEEGPSLIESEAEMPQVANGFNTPVEFSVRLVYSSGLPVHLDVVPKESESGIWFEGDRGSLFVNRTTLEGEPVRDLEHRPLGRDDWRPPPGPRVSFGANMGHLIDFLESIATGRQPISGVREAHLSARTCHLANLSMRLGRTLRWHAAKAECAEDSEANALFGRPQRAPYDLARWNL